MRHDIVWLTVSADRPRLEIDINDIPVARLGGSGARSMPVNEFLQAGTNHIVARLPAVLPADPHFPAENGQVRLSLAQSRWEEEERISEQSLFDAELDYVAAVVQPGGVLAQADFQSTLPSAIAMRRTLEPLGPDARALIIGKLVEVAAWWRNRDVEAFTAWTDAYVTEYLHAYPNEDGAAYRQSLRKMFGHFAGRTVIFDPAAAILRPCGGGRLVDCRAADFGPSIRIERDDGDSYPFWTTLGIVKGAVVFYR